MTITSYRDLTVWQHSVELFVAVTGLVRSLPLPDRLVFETQSRRAARSVAVNISEGHQRHDLGDHLRHLSFSRGSLGELETDLVLIARTTSADKARIAACERDADEVGRMLTVLHANLRRRR
jgi:four helix bundle protein